MFDQLIADAPEENEAPPWKESVAPPTKTTVEVVPKAETEDPFHQDPLIQAALKQFEGKVVSA
jgi:hypothetical protein